MSIEPAVFDPDLTPTATLAGKAWPILELAWSQLKTCRRALIELNGRLSEAVAAAPALADETDIERGLRHMTIMAALFNSLSDADCDRLVMAVIHSGLTAAHPDLTLKEFEGWRITELERQMAWLVVRRQSGLFVFSAPAGAADAGPAPGEADGAA